MFTLRMIDDQGQHNWLLGENYTFIGRIENPKDFRRMFKQIYNEDHVADKDENATDNTKNIIGFVTSDVLAGATIFKDNKYYIMSSNGKTFANLTY